MKRRSYGRDAGLSFRILLTSSLLGLLYVIFAVVLFNVLNVGLVPLVVIVVGIAFFQYFTSDKLALAASGAKVVERDQAPELHDMVERHMSGPLPMIGGGQPVSEAVALLEKTDAAVVLIDGKPAGVITRQDLLTHLT